MLTVLILMACVEYEDGRAQEGELACELHAACDTLVVLGYGDVDECITDAIHQEWQDCPSYSAESMQKCIDTWQDAVDTKDCSLEEESPAVCLQVCTV